MPCTFKAHNSPVKGIAWHREKPDILYTSGGKNDTSIKMWNTKQIEMIRSIKTDSQICNLSYSKKYDEIITTHGF